MSTVVAPTYVPLFLTELVCPSCATTCMHMHGPRARPRTLRAKIDSTTTTDFTLDVNATACWCIPLPSDVVPRYRDGSINRHGRRGRAARAWHEPAEASAGARPTASAAAEPPASAVRTARKPERKGKRPRRQHVKRSKAKTKPHKNRRQRQNREPPN
jgi:hypothetical protein